MTEAVCAQNDIRLIFASVADIDLMGLKYAITRNLLRKTGYVGNPVYWLSGKSAIDKNSLDEWIASLIFSGNRLTAVVPVYRFVAGWDRSLIQSATRLIESKPDYIVTESMLNQEIGRALMQRDQTALLEARAIKAAVKLSETRRRPKP